MGNVMLAESTTIEKTVLPTYASPKIDGVRCHIEDINGKPVALSRSNKPIPNKYIQHMISKHHALIGCDGELTVGPLSSTSLFRDTTSAVMTMTGKPDFQFNIFDHTDHPNELFFTRYETLQSLVLPKFAVLVEQKYITDRCDLQAYEEECLKKGYEGIMVRRGDAPYKFGRSTLKEGYLLKIKRFRDAEAVIIGFEQLYHNENEAFIDERGYTAHSSHAEGMVPADMLGALIVETDNVESIGGVECHEKITFKIGSGFDQDMRWKIWHDKKQYLGRVVKFKYFDKGGKEAPRFPVFLGFRSNLDR